MIYEKYIFGHLDDQAIYHIYLVFFHSSWLMSPKPLGTSDSTNMGASFAIMFGFLSSVRKLLQRHKGEMGILSLIQVLSTPVGLCS